MKLLKVGKLSNDSKNKEKDVVSGTVKGIAKDRVKEIDRLMKLFVYRD